MRENPVELASPGGEIRALTGLRIVAALWVVVYHFPWQANAAFAGLAETLTPVHRSGWIGVDLFFVLSGFVITHNYLARMGTRFSVDVTVRFLWARLARIWPLWALVTCGFWLWKVAEAWLVPGGTAVPLGVGHLLEQLSLVMVWFRADMFSTPPFVGPGWSLSAEWLAYVCFPLLVLPAWRVRRVHPAATGALAVAAMTPYAYLCYRTGDPHPDWEAIIRIAGGFTAGCLTCLAVRRIPRTPRVQQVAAVVCAFTLVDMALVIVWASWRGTVVPGADFHGVVIVFIPVLVAALALSTSGVAAFLSRPAMVHGGRISFSLYLVHVPLFQTWTLLSEKVSWLGGQTALGSLLTAHLLLVAIVAAHVLYRCVEEPGRRWMRRVGPRPPAAVRREPEDVTGSGAGATDAAAVRHAAA